MQDITALEQRITAALERIGKGVDRLAARPRPSPPQPQPPSAAGSTVPASEIEASLRTQLEEEKALTSKLQHRLRIMKERETKGDLQDKVDWLTQQLDVKGLELQRMRRQVATLREQLTALREAQSAGVTEPQLINKAMAAELETLKATRLSEIAELDDILSALEPHLPEAADARA